MIYTPDKVAHNTKVFDVMAGRWLDRVISLDTDTGVVVFCASPFKVDSRGHVETIELRFDAIHAISGGGRRPVLFHCYRHSPSLVLH